jgi:PAS domain S-box-containing protein
MAVNENCFGLGKRFPIADRSLYALDIPSVLHTSVADRVAKKPAPAPVSLKLAMRALLESGEAAVSDNELKTLLARVSDAMLEGVLVCGIRGDIRYVNDSLCQMVGRTHDELIGKPAAQYFGEIAARCRRAKQGDGRDRYETELRTQADRAIVVDVCSERIQCTKGAELGSFAVIMDITARANALRRSESELRLLSAQFMAAQELERQRIARDLHDSIGQALSGVKFGLETCGAQITAGSSGEALKTLHKFAARIQSIVEEVRRISMNLRPSTLDDLGILPTLGWFTREFRTIYVQLELDVRVQVSEDEIAAPVKTAIYRIVQEAFNNVVTHSGARKISLVLQRAGCQVELRIQDDGVGFEPSAFSVADQSGRGLGLASMRERAEVTGARFSVQSERGRGTTVRVSWPGYSARRARK